MFSFDIFRDKDVKERRRNTRPNLSEPYYYNNHAYDYVHYYS